MSAAEHIPEYHTAGVPIAQMQAVWPYVEGYFRNFEERSGGEYKAAELLHHIMRGERQCWIVTDGKEVKACALTEMGGPPMKAVIIGFCAGEDAELWWAGLVETVEEWARAMGSRRVKTINRPGWTKRLKTAGYRETHRVMEKNLDE